MFHGNIVAEGRGGVEWFAQKKRDALMRAEDVGPEASTTGVVQRLLSIVRYDVKNFGENI